jgi:hypothetical protein
MLEDSAKTERGWMASEEALTGSKASREMLEAATEIGEYGAPGSLGFSRAYSWTGAAYAAAEVVMKQFRKAAYHPKTIREMEKLLLSSDVDGAVKLINTLGTAAERRAAKQALQQSISQASAQSGVIGAVLNR